jgi:malate dehydrogenase
MKVSIMGASGVVGSATAYALASQGTLDEVLLVSRRPNLAASHALDIQAAISGRNNTRVRGGADADLAGSDIVIIAAGLHLPAAAPVEEKLAVNLPILQNISASLEKYCPGAVVITATNPVDLLNYGVYLSTSMERRQLIGFNLNDSTRFRMALAAALGLSATRVEGQVIGEHPQSPLLLFSSVKVDGRPFLVSAPVKRQVQAELKNYLGSFEALQAGRSAGWTTAAGLADMVRAIALDRSELLPVSAVLDGEYGYRGLSLGVPALIGQTGIRQILEWKLEAGELDDLEKIARLLQENCALVRRLTGSRRA